MSIKQFLMGIMLIPAVFALNACAVTHVAISKTQFAGYSDAPLAQGGIFQHPKANGGVIPPRATEEITMLNHSCQKQDRRQSAGLIQSTINGGVPGTAVGALSLGGAVDLAFKPSKLLEPRYYKEGAVEGGVQGAYNGSVTGARDAASTIGGCTRDFWNASKAHDPEFKAHEDVYWGTFFETIASGKGYNDSPPAADPNYKP